MRALPVIYSWDDSGSPGRNLSGNLQNRLKQILSACLVSGYGTKGPAGWKLAHEHENGFALENKEGDFVVNFVSNLVGINPLSIHIYTASSLYPSSEAIISGANLCSGLWSAGSGIQTRHMIPHASEILSDDIGRTVWTVVADEKTFVFNISNHNSQIESNGYLSFSIYVGDIADCDIKSSVVLGGNVQPITGGQSMDKYPYSIGFSAPINPATGLSERVVIGAEPFLNYIVGRYNYLPSYINPKPQKELAFRRPNVSVGGDYVGRLRGVAYDDSFCSTHGWPYHLKCLGLAEDYSLRASVVKLGGNNYVFARSARINSFLTDNPEFW